MGDVLWFWNGSGRRIWRSAGQVCMRRTGKRKQIFLRAALCFAAAALGCFSSYAAEESFMPLSEVKEGMRGYAKTVVHGREITTFDVDVMGIMKNKGANGGDLILVRVSGPVIDESNGIAQGMSGSPVYIDGKLVGAVAYGFPQSGGRIGMVTPISDMLRLWTIDDRRAPSLLPEPSTGLVPVATPLMASGYSESAMKYLSDKMGSFQMVPYAAAADEGDSAPYPLEAGGAVAASLVTGDLKLGAIGTVTYVDGDHMVAFGHPFRSEGTSSYFMHNSYIFTVIPSQNIPFKLGSVGAEIGEVDQDRGAGISGVSGITPDSTALHASVTDLDLGAEKDMSVRMIRDESLLPTLAATSVYNAVSQVIDRQGEGTVALSYTLYPDDEKQAPFTRSNLYWAKNDVAEKSVDELYNVVKILAQNRFEPYPLRRIQVDMDVTKERRTAQLLDATATPMIVSPGDSISIRVRLEPYRGKIFFKDLVFRVPEDQPYGDMVLEVRGGGVIPLPYLMQQQKYNLTDEILERLRTYKDFRDLQDKLMKEDRNNQIVAEILDPEVSMITRDGESAPDVKIQDRKKVEEPDYLKNGDAGADKGKEKEEAVSRVETDYVIYGDGQFTFQVMPEKKRDEALARLKSRKEALLLNLKNQEKEEMKNAGQGADEKTPAPKA